MRIKPASSDDRGTTFKFKTRKSDSFFVAHRKKGSTSGKHYHLGKTASKNPEIFYIIEGSVRILVKDIKDKKTEEHTVLANSLVQIDANVYHEVYALTDTTFVEFAIDNENVNADTTWPHTQ